MALFRKKSSTRDAVLDALALGQLADAEPGPLSATQPEPPSSSGTMGRLLVRHGLAASMWTAADYRDELAGLLAAPLPAAPAGRPAPHATVADALHARPLDEPALRAAKALAKRRIVTVTQGPSEPAVVLYYLLIATGRAARVRVSKLSDHAIRLGVQWVLEQRWLPDDLRQVAADAMRRIPPEA